MSFDVVLVTDTASYPHWTRGYGAHRLANHLRTNGYTTLVIDFASSLTFDIWKSICKLAIGSNTKMLGFSTTWWPYRDAETNAPITELKKFKIETETLNSDNVFIKDFATGNSHAWILEAKQNNENIKVVLGGPKIDWYQDVPADHFVSGLGETQVIDLLEDKNRIFNKLVNHDTEAKHNWSWNDSNTLYTDFDFIKQREFLNLETSRGCRFKCAFCSYPLIGKKNMMSFMKCKDALYAELMENYEKWGVTDYGIVDDTLNDSTEKLEYLLDVTRKLPFKLRLRAYVRIDVIAVNPQQMEMLKELGITYAWIGIDSFHPKASKIIGKGMDAQRRKDALIKLRECWGDDAEIVASYIIGLPEEDKQSVLDTYDWLASDDSPLDHVEFIPLRLIPPGPLPNVNRSTIDRNYKEYGYTVPDMSKWWDWYKTDNTDILDFTSANKLADNLNEKYLKRTKKRILNQPDFVRIEDPLTEYFEPLTSKLRSIYESKT